MKLLAIAAAAVSLAGCASVVNESTQPIRVDAVTRSGETLADSDCTLSNAHGTIKSKSGTIQIVHRSSDDLHVVCEHPGQSVAIGTVTSRANAGMAGNLLLGGAIGVAVDHYQGTGYSYPGWVQVVFGQQLAYDRLVEQSGAPQKGM